MYIVKDAVHIKACSTVSYGSLVRWSCFQLNCCYTFYILKYDL